VRLRTRIIRLERKSANRDDEVTNLSDQELEARILELASALEAEGDLDPELAERVKAMGWIGSDARH